MQGVATNRLGKREKHKKIKEGPCLFPFKYKRQEHSECLETAPRPAKRGYLHAHAPPGPSTALFGQPDDDTANFVAGAGSARLRTGDSGETESGPMPEFGRLWEHVLQAD